MKFLQEILQHADRQDPEDTLVAVGGMHTTESMQICMEQIENGEFSRPQRNPFRLDQLASQGFFFEGPLARHWQPLLAMGNIDNEPLALQVSFYDKLLKLRELMINVFGDVEAYREAALAAKHRSNEELKAQYDEFKTQARAALRVAVVFLVTCVVSLKTTRTSGIFFFALSSVM